MSYRHKLYEADRYVVIARQLYEVAELVVIESAERYCIYLYRRKAYALRCLYAVEHL